MEKKEKEKRIKALIRKGKRKKHLSYKEINEALPEEMTSVDEIESILDRLDRVDILVEEEEVFLTHEEDKNLLLEDVKNPVRTYLREAGEVPLLTRQQEIEIASGIEEMKKKINQGKRKGCSEKQLAGYENRLEKLRERIIRANLRLVINIAKRYTNPKLTLRDLIQEGNIGLMRAVEKFKYRQGFKFSTYATWWIRQAITRAIADHSTTIRVPVHMREKISKLNKLSRKLYQRYDRDPTIEEISERLDQPLDKIKLILKSIRQEPLSLEAPVGDEEKTSFGDFIDDKEAPSPAHSATFALLREEIEKILSTLEEREERIIRLRFGIGTGYSRTLEEVGNIFELTRERIRQIEAKTLEKVRSSPKIEKLLIFLELLEIP